jgi:hypothetical protein
MNATALVLPSWTADIQRYSQKPIFYTSIVWQAFNKMLAPVIVASLKGISHHCVERERLWRQWVMNTAGISHNPIQAAFNAAHSELLSEEAITTYRRIRYLLGETAMVLLGFGLGLVLPFLVVINLALGGYRVAEQVLRAVYGRLNPSLSISDLLMPSVGMAIAGHQPDSAAAQTESVDVAEVEAEAIFLQSAEAVEQPAPEATQRGRGRAQIMPQPQEKGKGKQELEAKVREGGRQGRR